MNARPVAAALAVLLIPTASLATDLYSPSLPAGDGQYLECRALNVSGAPADVTVTAFATNGVLVSGPTTQTIENGQAGGFPVPSYYASMYCKFSFEGEASAMRASVAILSPNDTGSSFKVMNALSAY